jgi:hypothetical protein
MNATFNTRLNSVQEPGIVQQIIVSVTFIVVLYLVFVFMELLYRYSQRLNKSRTQLLPYTYNIDTKPIVIPQNPNNNGSTTIYQSNNERTGIEFTYSFYINVNASTFRNEKGLLHIFHKGYPQQFPLLAPGVYLRSDTNTLRVYMNTYKTWNNYIEVDNFPVGKWVHVAIVCTENSLEIYINGNLSKKMPFEGYQPYQNFQDICCFSQRRITMRHSLVPSVDEDGFDVFGAVKGLISRLNYYSYALCYAEINSLVNEGPSTRLESDVTNTNIPPYLDDTWWSKSY